MHTRCFKVLVLLISLLAWPSLDVQAAPIHGQRDFFQTAGSDLARAHRRMENMIREIIRKNASDRVFVARLRASQRAWIAYRDAELAARFPLAKGQDPHVEYGSVYPHCTALELLQLTRERIEQLKPWLTPGTEGDVCGGSWPMKQDP